MRVLNGHSGHKVVARKCVFKMGTLDSKWWPVNACSTWARKCGFTAGTEYSEWWRVHGSAVQHT